jgi:hypothetical protein
VRSLTRHYKELMVSRSDEKLVTPPAPATEIESTTYA